MTEPKSPLFANANHFKHNKSPAFKKFCADELPPLSPAFNKYNRNNLIKTPQKIKIKDENG